MIDIFIIFSGLGLFLSGLNLVSLYSSEITGKIFCQLLRFFSTNAFRQSIIGSFLGMATQSTAASTYMMIGLIKSGKISFKHSMMILAWSSVGTSLLVFVAATDIYLVGLFLLSLISIFYLINLSKIKSLNNILGLILAFGLLFMGLGMIKNGSMSMQDSFWIKEFLEFSSETIWIGFIIGIFLSLITQSASTVSILTITLVASQIIPIFAAAVILIGANLGSGVSLLITSTHFDDPQRRSIFVQFITKFLGSFFMLILIINWPNLFFSFRDTASESLTIAQTELAILYLYLQLSGATLFSIFSVKFFNLLIKYFPDSAESDNKKLKFIYPDALVNPSNAIDLIILEQDRVLTLLLAYIERVRESRTRDFSHKENQKNCRNIMIGIKSFTDDLINHTSNELQVNFFSTQSVNESLSFLIDALNDFLNSFNASKDNKISLNYSMLESLHLIFSLVIEKNYLQDDTLLVMTSDKNQLMESIRDNLLEKDNLRSHEKKALFQNTRLYERVILHINHIILLKK